MFKEIQLWFTSFFGKNKEIEKSEELKLEESDPKQYISYHAKMRFEQRHGTVFTDAQAKSIVADIISKKAQFIKECPGKAEQWIAEYEGKKYKVVFSLENEVIVTVYSGIKNKRSKPSRRKKKINNGRVQRSLNKKPKPIAYKRNKKVVYEESVL